MSPIIVQPLHQGADTAATDEQQDGQTPSFSKAEIPVVRNSPPRCKKCGCIVWGKQRASPGARSEAAARCLTLRDDLEASLKVHQAWYTALLDLLSAAANDPDAPEHIPEPEWEPYQALLDRAAGGDIATGLWLSLRFFMHHFERWHLHAGSLLESYYSACGLPSNSSRLVVCRSAGVFWPGFPWLRVRGSNLIVGFEHDATAIL